MFGLKEAAEVHGVSIVLAGKSIEAGASSIATAIIVAVLIAKVETFFASAMRVMAILKPLLPQRSCQKLFTDDQNVNATGAVDEKEAAVVPLRKPAV
jgi:hypothetical protein